MWHNKTIVHIAIIAPYGLDNEHELNSFPCIGPWMIWPELELSFWLMEISRYLNRDLRLWEGMWIDSWSQTSILTSLYVVTHTYV